MKRLFLVACLVFNVANMYIAEAADAGEEMLEGLFECPICFEIKADDEQWKLPIQENDSCGHSFCRDCIVQSALRNLKCPLCRTVLSLSDVPPLPERLTNFSSDFSVDEDRVLNAEEKNIYSLQGLNDFDRAGDVRMLVLDNNYISTLSENNFSNFVNLESLSLSFNPLITIDENSFVGLSGLKRLYLEDVKLNSVNNGVLPENLFTPLSALEGLILDGNNLDNLSNNIFSHLTALKFLSLGENSFVSLPHDLLMNLVALEDIDFENCERLQELPDTFFTGLVNLKSVDFTNTPIANDQEKRARMESMIHAVAPECEVVFEDNYEESEDDIEEDDDEEEGE